MKRSREWSRWLPLSAVGFAWLACPQRAGGSGKRRKKVEKGGNPGIGIMEGWDDGEGARRKASKRDYPRLPAITRDYPRRQHKNVIRRRQKHYGGQGLVRL